MASLEIWEKRLAPYFGSHLRIIGEIMLSLSDVEEIAAVVKSCIHHQGLTRATEILTKQFPCTYLTLMAEFAAHNVQQNYWQAFADLVGADKPGLYNQGWHHKFVELAKKKGFKVFDFGDDPTPYVTSIRFQGGIPTYSLPDYFSRMVLPAVQRPGLREVSPTQALNTLINTVYFVDSPVLDFLKNSSELGVEFFAESCRMARHALEHNGEILPPDMLSLPLYVVRAFENWLERIEDEKQHWRKPALVAAPYSEDTVIFVLLPAQEISLSIAMNQIRWQVSWTGIESVIERPCDVFRQRQNVITKEDFLPIHAAPANLTVSLSYRNEETQQWTDMRRWNLPLVPQKEQAPLLAFKADFRQLPVGEPLLPAPLYLLYPNDAELEFDGEARKLETCVELIGAWQNWQMNAWDLTQCWSVRVTHHGIVLGANVPIQGTLAQPELTDGHLFLFQENPEQPFYTSELPSVKIPLNQTESLHSQLAKWQIRMRSIWDAVPCIDSVVNLNSCLDKIDVKDDRAIFPLSILLGNQPAGTFKVVVIGPREIRAEFSFRYWPKLLLHGHSMQLIRPAQADKPCQFYLKMNESSSCENQAGAEFVKIENSPTGWKVIAGPEVNRVLLNLLTPSSNHATVRLPVSIPLPRLRWGLGSDQNHTGFKWERAVIQKSLDQLLQSGSSALHVEMYGLGEMLNHLRVELVELGETETVLQTAKLIRTDFTKDWLRISLSQFRGTLQKVNSLSQFVLVYMPDRTENPLRIPLVELTRNLEITDTRLIQIDDLNWILTWQEAQPLKNRRVMFVPVWQPWQKLEDWEYKIPDKARGELLIEGISLPKSHYEIYFYVNASWERPRTQPPEGLAPFVIDLCNPSERLEKVRGVDGTANDKFKACLEAACIFDSLNEIKQRDLYLSKCTPYLIHLNNLQLLLGGLKWIKPRNVDPQTKSFFYIAMFNLELVEMALQQYRPDDPELIEYLRYATQVKSLYADSARLITKKVSDPVVVAACLAKLLEKKDDMLPRLVSELLERARLSRRDAILLLSGNPCWALEKLAELDSNPLVDSLFAGLLFPLGQRNEQLLNNVLAEWIYRALPYVEDDQVYVILIRHLITMGETEVFKLLIDAHIKNKIDEGQVLEIFKLNLKMAIQYLEKFPLPTDQQKWLEMLFDLRDGVQKGSQLQTPLGVATVEYIEHVEQGPIPKTRLGDPNSILHMVVGKGGDQIRINVDFLNEQISLEKTGPVWKCSICGFIHPEQRKVYNHCKVTHISLAMSPISTPISFLKEKIKLVDSQ